MVKEKRDILVLSLVIVVVLLLGFLAYLFLISPALSGLVNQGQTEGYQYAILSIAQQAATCPTDGVPLTVGNQTMTLVALECYQQQAAQ
jgi:hypothetical protein